MQVVRCNAFLKVEPEITECYMEAPSYPPSKDDLLVKVKRYYYHDWTTSRTVFNITFPSAGWNVLKFRYQDLDDGNSKPLCRKFTLANVSIPLSDEIFWDCPVFVGSAARQIRLTVITDEGKGGTYSFKTSTADKIDPWKTRLQDWQVFFYLHDNHIGRSPHLPVTIQLAPFYNVSYNISLVKCVDDDGGVSCSQRTVLASHKFHAPENISSDEDILETKLLQLWHNPGTYAVTAQILSSECPDGCAVAMSPPFSVPQSKLGLWICVGFGFLLIFTFAFTFTLQHRLKQNKKLLLTAKDNTPTLLLIYLPENQRCLDLVNKLAHFLKHVCYVHPFVIDADVGSKVSDVGSEVGSEAPSCWTSEHMNKADRLLFLVPGNPDAESITPIRDHWVYALHYLTGHYFTTNQVTNKVATVVLPFSARVPHQIANVQRFRLMQDINSLVTWIHSGTWMDSKFLWGPQIRSPAQEKITYTFSDIKQAVHDACQVTKCCNDYKMDKISDEEFFYSEDSTKEKTSPKSSVQDVEKNTSQQYQVLTHPQDGDDDDPFDKQLLDVEELPMLGGDTGTVRDHYPSSDDNSDELDDSIFL
ncbi:hypothetical protein Hamer_G019073 [Homarus americanus]|uniref:SEFIR domain-containing protein n=1 Tax=Homarus americanus TaxID=6706 RepID=A0A8J5K1M3_HOMAM|nr:hypothetical protein Hamer_G019073 [Homarus americanus]